jgi:hypothetical protein
MPEGRFVILERAVEVKKRKQREQREQRGREFGWIEFPGALTFGVRLVGHSILIQLLVSPFPLLPPVESNSLF